jgi:dihydropteroate synthase
MRLIDAQNMEEAGRSLAMIGADERGIAKMAAKGLARAIKLERVPLRVAHILKQEMLSLGGDAAVHREVITNGVDTTDVMLLGTVAQLRKLAKKLDVQPFGLKELGRGVSRLLQYTEPPVRRGLDCRGRALIFGERTLIMGILNVTPDSFSDGGKFSHPDAALERALNMVAEGADILDIGAESTRHGYVEVSAQEEWRRLEPVLPALIEGTSVPISVDTSKAEVAEKALALGVHMINDVWGLRRDPEMAAVAARYQSPVIVMHNREDTAYQRLMGEIVSLLRESIALAEAQGLQGDQIIVDPGFGFGKTPRQNLEVLARLSELKSLGRPILLGTSRKSTIGKALDAPVEERLEGTIATNVLGVAAGADIIRVHDVAAHRRAIQMTDAIVRGQRGRCYEGA